MNPSISRQLQKFNFLSVKKNESHGWDIDNRLLKILFASIERNFWTIFENNISEIEIEHNLREHKVFNKNLIKDFNNKAEYDHLFLQHSCYTLDHFAYFINDYRYSPGLTLDVALLMHPLSEEKKILLLEPKVYYESELKGKLVNTSFRNFSPVLTDEWNKYIEQYRPKS